MKFKNLINLKNKTIKYNPKIKEMKIYLITYLKLQKIIKIII